MTMSRSHLGANVDLQMRHQREIATRYAKNIALYLAAIHIKCILAWASSPAYAAGCDQPVILLTISCPALRPAPMARITVAAPVTMSPPAKTLGMEVSPVASFTSI